MIAVGYALFHMVVVFNTDPFTTDLCRNGLNLSSLPRRDLDLMIGIKNQMNIFLSCFYLL